MSKTQSKTQAKAQAKTQAKTQASAHSNALLETLPEIVSDIASDGELEREPLIPWMFNVEGIFLGLLGEPPEKVTAIAVEVDQEEMAIALPKKLQCAVKDAVRRHTLQLGDRVRCIGRSQLNFSAGVIQLKAYCLFTDTRQTQQAIEPQPVRKKDKIMVCHKSGCKKRGGRQLVATLERTLREQHLEDRVDIQYTGCQKRCSKAPGLVIMPGKHRYDGLSPKDVPALIKKHFLQDTAH